MPTLFTCSYDSLSPQSTLIPTRIFIACQPWFTLFTDHLTPYFLFHLSSSPSSFYFPLEWKKNLPAMRSHLAFSQLSLDCRRSSSYSLSFFPVTFLILHSFLPCFLKRECFGETRKSVVKKLAANLRFIGSILSLPDLDEGGNESRRSLPLSSSLLFDRVYFPYPF